MAISRIIGAASSSPKLTRNSCPRAPTQVMRSASPTTSALSPIASLYPVRSHCMGLTLAVAAVGLLGPDGPLRTSAALATTNIVPIMIQIAVRVFRFIFYLDGYSIYNALRLDGVVDLAVPPSESAPKGR